MTNSSILIDINFPDSSSKKYYLFKSFFPFNLFPNFGNI